MTTHYKAYMRACFSWTLSNVFQRPRPRTYPVLLQPRPRLKHQVSTCSSEAQLRMVAPPLAPLGHPGGLQMPLTSKHSPSQLSTRARSPVASDIVPRCTHSLHLPHPCWAGWIHVAGSAFVLCPAFQFHKRLQLCPQPQVMYLPCSTEAWVNSPSPTYSRTPLPKGPQNEGADSLGVFATPVPKCNEQYCLRKTRHRKWANQYISCNTQIPPINALLYVDVHVNSLMLIF